MIKVTDSFGVDTHFIRFLQLALFDSRPLKVLISTMVLKDCFYLTAVIIPLFIIGLRYWTSPVYLKYTLKLNSLVGPIALLPIFHASHMDILCLGVLVLFMNIYSFWCHVDPPRESYAGGKYTTKRPNTYDSSDEDIRYTESKTFNKVLDGAEAIRNSVGAYGVPPSNFISHY